MAELDRLRRAYREIGPDGSGHLSDDQWEWLASDEMTPVEKEEALDHILTCSECSVVYRGVMAVRMEAHTFDPGAPVPASGRRPARSGRWRGLMVGLAAAAAVVVAVLVVRPRTVPRPAAPGGSQPITLRSAGRLSAPTPVAPLGVLSSAPGAFSWQPVPGARGYLVELLDGDGEPLWRSGEVTDVRVAWPETVPAAPGRYYWRVLAVPQSGGAPVASELVSFEIGLSASRRSPGTPPSGRGAAHP